jgi:hypothetical protein
MSAKSDYIVLIDAGQACICNQYGGVRNRVGDYGATSANISSDREFFIVSYRDYVCIFRWDGSMHRRICPDSMWPERASAEIIGLSSTKSEAEEESSIMTAV